MTPASGTPGALPAKRSIRSAQRKRVIRDGVSLGGAVGLYGAAFGAASTAADLSLWQSAVLSLVMFTGASQFALVGVLAAGGGPLAAIGGALLLGTRNTVYGVRLAGLLSYRGWRRVAAAHWVIDETTALTVRETEQGLARLAFLSSGSTLFLVWNLTTIAGALGAQSFGPVLQAALDSVVPAAFLALLWPRLVSNSREAGNIAGPSAARGADRPVSGASEAPQCTSGAPVRDQRLVALGGSAIALGLTPILPAGLQIIAATVAVLLAVRGARSSGTDGASSRNEPRAPK